MIESVIGLYKTECVRHDGPFRRVDDFELATLSIPTTHGGSALPIGDLRQLYVYSLARRVPQGSRAVYGPGGPYVETTLCAIWSWGDCDCGGGGRCGRCLCAFELRLESRRGAAYRC